MLRSKALSSFGNIRINTSFFVPNSAPLDPESLTRFSDFISQHHGGIFVLTGAGVSTESGIPDYRSEGVGLYATSSRRPMAYVKFLKNTASRKRYWARSYVGWNIYREYQPNLTHRILSYLERNDKMFHWLVTQNVDGLHTKAGSLKLTELHGSLHRVLCLSCGITTSREEVQSMIKDANSAWRGDAGELAPDGDVTVPTNAIDTFQMPDCPSCGGILKPDIVFFGDNVLKHKTEFVQDKLSRSSALLVVGSSLQVYSAYRLILRATSENIPIAIVNIGQTRGDEKVDLKISCKSSQVFQWLAKKRNIIF